MAENPTSRIPDELKKKIFFTLGLLLVYRLGCHIPTPGINPEALKTLFETMQGTIFGWFNLFSGGALERFSIMALGVMPYISSSIIMQLLTVTWPWLAELQKEGVEGRRKITKYTRYLTVLICFIQGYGISTWLEAQQSPQVVLEGGMAFRFLTTVTLTGGTVFLMWLGEQITEKGLGNGISMIIFAGIAAGIPAGAGGTFGLLRTGNLSLFNLGILLTVIVATFLVIVFVEQAQRRVPIQYAKRIIGRKIYGGQNSFLPLKVNAAGVIPPIFASSLIMFPATVANFVPLDIFKRAAAMMNPGAVLYNILFVAMIVFFCFFYTAIVTKTDDMAENLKKSGGFVPGIRPGPPTADYLDYVISRVTAGGAVYISIICVVPSGFTQGMNVPFYFGGTSVLILVGVGIDIVRQIQVFMLNRNYEGFMRGARVRGRGSSVS